MKSVPTKAGRAGWTSILTLVLVLALIALIALTPAVAGAEGWRSAQPPPPLAPEGEKEVGAPVPLGHIGQISFWAPNRGLLITSGTEVVPAGLYYYNGISWRELSTVCGGTDGRIVWTGENNFWTISNQQAGQQVGTGVNVELARQNISLCHFENGAFVASYAEPIGAPDSYRQMDAAACSEPNDCWFGGEALSGAANSGAFHLHWNGQTVTPVPSLETPEPQLEDPPYPVTSMAYLKGHIYESVQEPTSSGGSSPLLIHRIAEGSSKPFVPLLIEGPLGEPFSATVSELTFGADATQLWAAGGSVVLRLTPKGQFQQLKTSGSALPGPITAVAAEPGGEGAWLALGEVTGASPSAGVAHIQANGTVDAVEQLPEAGEGLADKGAADAIACPAQGDCWLASQEGWLFHLGGNYPEDHDPYFQSLITYRPQDASIPYVPPETFPEDDSGDNPASIPAAPSSSSPATAPTTIPAPLYSDVQDKLLKHSTLAVSFTLATKSRVRLLAMRHKHTVAASARVVLAQGRHTLRLRLRRNAWPTKLDLQVQALGPVPVISTGAGGGPEAGKASNGPGTIVTNSLRVLGWAGHF